MSAYSLNDIAYQIEEGDWSGIITTKRANTTLSGKNAVRAIIMQGSDTDFFNMDENDFDLDEPDEE